jgi:preprotein translocase subunit SecE
MLTKIQTYFKEVFVEMKKVNWPTRKETIRYTLLVIGISVAVAAYLGGLDFIFTRILEFFVI